MSSIEGENQNPRKWRFTWEAQSHNPTLKLFLFNHTTKPKRQCLSLKVDLKPLRNVVEVNFVAENGGVSLVAPVPKVLIDYESPLSFRALDDHIEVKLALLLPVGHPLISNFDEVMCVAGDVGRMPQLDDLEPLSMATDIESLTSKEGVNFYCRSCSSKLTENPIRDFVEMPSLNWQEAADNWFGGCCCSFGGVSEKLVASYAKSYMTLKGRCFLDQSAVIICKDDLLDCQFPECNGAQNSEIVPNSKLAAVAIQKETNGHHSCCQNPTSDGDSSQIRKSESESISGTSHSLNSKVCDCPSDLSENKHRCLAPTKEIELQGNQKSFLNGFLGNVFMAKSYNLSAAIDWVEFRCPHCSQLLGAYPSTDGGGPLDGGVRLYKCYVSTGLPVLGSNDIFKKYTLERIFANQILQNAEDEISFRTIVNDLKTRLPMIQIVLMNPDSWYCSGYCSEAAGSPAESAFRVSLRPAIKVLFCNRRDNTHSQKGKIERWSGQHNVDEVFMMPCQIEALAECLDSAKALFRGSLTLLEGFSLSSILK